MSYRIGRDTCVSRPMHAWVTAVIRTYIGRDTPLHRTFLEKNKREDKTTIKVV